MPKTTPVSTELRRRINCEIEMGFGRNELARRHDVSPGLVSKIARESGLFFEKSVNTAPATRAHQIDMWAARVDRENEIMQEYLALPST
jgi:hypothetical protein